MPTTTKSITGRKKRNSALKSRQKSTRITRKTQRKSSYFIKRKENENINLSSTLRTHAKFEKLKRQIRPKLNEKANNKHISD
jgi:hypothetical protein